MLRHLLIENYGLIPRAEIAFADGATIFTGETGSGKTMLLGALGFVLGDRASADSVRRGASRATVTLVFEPDERLRARLNDEGFGVDADEDAIVVREVNDSGKSSVRINGRPATAAFLRDIAAATADVVGQHDAQRLLAPAYHGELLDRFGGEPTVRALEAVRSAHTAFEAVRARLDALEGDERAARRRYEDALFDRDEIDSARIEVGEDERLTERRRFLDNVERVTGGLQSAHAAFAADEGATSTLGIALEALTGIRGISAELDAVADQTAALQSESEELAGRIARELDATEFDPAELETINARLDALDRLKRKHGGTLASVLAHAETSRTIVGDFESRDERLVELRAQRDAAQTALERAAAVLTKQRKNAATLLAKHIVGDLRELALPSASFDAAFELLPEIAATGAERVEFAFAANAGEPMRPLARVASGGELSRVLLALVIALAGTRDRTALVFDEIDTGVGGATAGAVGTRLGRLARDGQVLCVTHLAQIATWADRHYVLEKLEENGSTSIAVREIATRDARERELARMLSGETHETALKHARTLISSARK